MRFVSKIKFTSLKSAEARVVRFLRGLAHAKGFTNLPRDFLRDLKLAVMEGLGNAFQHGSCSLKQPALLRLQAGPKQIEMTLDDWGKGFNLKTQLGQVSADLVPSGRGLWIMKNLVDRVSYKKGRPNRLVLVKKLTRPKGLDVALELTGRLQESLQQLKSMENLYSQFIDFLMGLFNVERASFLVFDREARVLRVATSRGISAKVARSVAIRPGEGVAGYVFQTARPLLVNNLSRVPRGTPRPRQKGYASKSFVSIPVIASPLHIGEETIGVLNLTDRRDGQRFTEKDLKLLTLMANHAATLFRIRHLIDTVRQHEGINRELQIVSEIQDRLIPDKFPHLPGVQIGGLHRLSPRGGGDYYDVLRINGRIRGVMADVSGHNVASAITMASFRSIVRSLAFDPNSPGEILRALRWAMHEELIRLQQFISCWVFEYLPNGQLKVAGAGHPPVLVYRAKQNDWESVFSQQLPLGLEDESRIQNSVVHLNAEDWAFFYTDGLFDPRMRETGFDRQKVLEVVEKQHRLTPQRVCEKIFDELKSHHQLLRHPDDVALLALKQK
jgi:serine phosphatase RsbU (regulator of sigma subunit)/anti-sigma regulatory factor (Ser/Thr protein kinase)